MIFTTFLVKTEKVPQTFHILLWKEDTIYVAKCNELGIASQGYTKEEALNNIKEATELYLGN